MKWTASFAAVLAAMLLLCLASAAALTPDRGLENPVLLAEMGNRPMYYGAYDGREQEFLAAYAEYDDYASGHGAVFLRTDRGDKPAILSYVGAVGGQPLTFGYGIHRELAAEGSWSVDFGAAYTYGILQGRLGLHGLPLDSWEGIKDHRGASVGASVLLSEAFRVGLDIHMPAELLYRGYLQWQGSPNVQVRVAADYRQLEWQSLGGEIWLRRDPMLVRFSYQVTADRSASVRIGFGIEF